MPFPLHKSPRGLLELFRLRTLGAAPPRFGEDVTPGVDVTEFYGSDLVVVAVETFLNVAFPANVTSVASQNARRLLALSGTCTFGAAVGTVISMRLLLVAPDGSAVDVGTISAAPNFVGQLVAVVAQFPTPLVLPPGFSYRLFASSDAAGADHDFTIRYMFQRLDNAL